MTTRNRCNTCGNLFIRPCGPADARILLVGEFPSYDDVRAGVCGSGKIGEILRHELARAGIQHAACRHTNLWQHPANKECDPAMHLDIAIKEFMNRDWIILMGSEITKALLGVGVMEVCGLRVKVKMFPKQKFFVIPNPGSLIRGDLGEMRLALEKFTALQKGKK